MGALRKTVADESQYLAWTISCEAFAALCAYGVDHSKERHRSIIAKSGICFPDFAGARVGIGSERD
jgi:hypothetical protein